MRLDWDDPADGPALRDFFRAFDPPPPAARTRLHYIIDEAGRVRRGSRRLGRAATAVGRARLVSFDLGDAVPDRAAPALVLHAGAVSRRGRGLLLPAPGKGGKSTLTLGLLLAGWTYHSDDLAVIRGPATRPRLGTFPRPIDLRPGALDLLGALGRDFRVTVDPGGDGGRSAVRVSRRRVARRPAAVRWVVFPHVRLRRPTVVRPIGRAEAAVRLARMACNLDRLGAGGFEALAGLLRGASCHLLEVGRLRDGLRALAEISGAADVASRASTR